MVQSVKYKTKQRETILSFLRDNPEKCMTIDEIALRLNVGKTTVYRMLNTLNEAGDVRKYIAGRGDSATYQYIEKDECKNHLHLKCTECGKILHLDCDFNDMIENHFLNHHKFKIEASKTVIYGKCEACSEAD